MTTGTRAGRPPSRRTLLLGAGALAAGPLGASSWDRPRPTAAPAPRTTTGRSPSGGRRVLLAYFSRPGENYHHGGRRDLTVGNTEVVANLIAERLPVDAHRIEAADPYPADDEETVARNLREQQDDARPALAAPPPSLDGYDTVLLGSPVWNVRTPMIMWTLLEQVDLTGKQVLPFVTYAVSGMGRVAEEYADLAPGATVGDGAGGPGRGSGAGRPGRGAVADHDDQRQVGAPRGSGQAEARARHDVRQRTASA